MWLLKGATSKEENIRIALFSSYEKALIYLNSNTDYLDGNIRIFKNGPLYNFVFVKIEYEEEVPLDPT